MVLYVSQNLNFFLLCWFGFFVGDQGDNNTRWKFWRILQNWACLVLFSARYLTRPSNDRFTTCYVDSYFLLAPVSTLQRLGFCLLGISRILPSGHLPDSFLELLLLYFVTILFFFLSLPEYGSTKLNPYFYHVFENLNVGIFFLLHSLSSHNCINLAAFCYWQIVFLLL
ncbi:hypothetical protein MANES_01G106150v8 [Manihot esculenta]|uniref:Uncharacterized protein n=2 Tax=Manihot esculenta TaxID=3983 RepID=A0ACB7IC47_MANES|nr:hypothetical protein MANES_01G106150v8 [Manihot esculenta]KAG8662437.1 hypothetical protein MANES_01G106150v8 [Manihot esculenta]